MRMRELKNKSVRLICAFLVAAFATSVSFSQQMQEPAAGLDLSKYKLDLVYSNDFGKPQNIVYEENLIRTLANGKQLRASTPDKRAIWIAEGRGGVDIRDGKLRVSPTPFDQ